MSSGNGFASVRGAAFNATKSSGKGIAVHETFHCINYSILLSKKHLLHCKAANNIVRWWGSGIGNPLRATSINRRIPIAQVQQQPLSCSSFLLPSACCCHEEQEASITEEGVYTRYTAATRCIFCWKADRRRAEGRRAIPQCLGSPPPSFCCPIS